MKYRFIVTIIVSLTVFCTSGQKLSLVFSVKDSINKEDISAAKVGIREIDDKTFVSGDTDISGTVKIDYDYSDKDLNAFILNITHENYYQKQDTFIVTKDWLNSEKILYISAKNKMEVNVRGNGSPIQGARIEVIGFINEQQYFTNVNGNVIFDYNRSQLSLGDNISLVVSADGYLQEEFPIDLSTQESPYSLTIPITLRTNKRYIISYEIVNSNDEGVAATLNTLSVANLQGRQTNRNGKAYFEFFEGDIVNSSNLIFSINSQGFIKEVDTLKLPSIDDERVEISRRVVLRKPVSTLRVLKNGKPFLRTNKDNKLKLTRQKSYLLEWNNGHPRHKKTITVDDTIQEVPLGASSHSLLLIETKKLWGKNRQHKVGDKNSSIIKLREVGSPTNPPDLEFVVKRQNGPKIVIIGSFAIGAFLWNAKEKETWPFTKGPAQLGEPPIPPPPNQ